MLLEMVHFHWEARDGRLSRITANEFNGEVSIARIFGVFGFRNVVNVAPDFDIAVNTPLIYKETA